MLYLIVIGKGDNGTTNPQNHRGMDLTMRVCIRIGLLRIVPGIHKILVEIPDIISCPT